MLIMPGHAAGLWIVIVYVKGCVGRTRHVRRDDHGGGRLVLDRRGCASWQRWMFVALRHVNQLRIVWVQRRQPETCSDQSLDYEPTNERIE